MQLSHQSVASYYYYYLLLPHYGPAFKKFSSGGKNLIPAEFKTWLV
jgi:hypothetical protein